MNAIIIIIIIFINSSSHGLGAHFVLEGQVTAYALRSLSKKEQKYSQLEKELHAIIYSFKRFCHYLYSCQIDVTNDIPLSKPL